MGGGGGPSSLKFLPGVGLGRGVEFQKLESHRENRTHRAASDRKT